MLGASLAAAFIAHAGMRLQMPLIDGQLAATDRMLGIDTPALVLLIARSSHAATILGVAYASTALVFAMVLVASLRVERRQVWTLAYGYTGCILLCSLISVFLPALGNFQSPILKAADLSALPPGAGIYAMDSVHYFRDGTNPLLDFEGFNGVVTFPSFHAVLAVLIAYSARSWGLLRWPVYGWSVLILISTIPIGGHYVIDIIAGVALWALLMIALRGEGGGVANASQPGH